MFNLEVKSRFLSEQGELSTEIKPELETEKLWEFFALFVGEPEFVVDNVSYLTGKIEEVSIWK